MYVKRTLNDAEAVLSLSREQLAGYVLEDLNARAKGHYHGDRNFQENHSNYLNGVEAEYKNQDVTDAFAAAWRFMIDQGYVSESPGQMAHGWYRLTARGRGITQHDMLQAPRVPRDINPGPAPSFLPLTSEPALLKHIHVLWEEAVMADNGNAHLATVIMLGSLLEGALLAKCMSNNAAAQSAANAPKERNGVVKDYRWWTLNDFIEVASELSWIHSTRNDFADTLRDYRNMVHPFNAYNRGYHVDRDTVAICWAVVRATLHDLGLTV
jgi:hypothetical protein